MTAKTAITSYQARLVNKFTKYSLDQITPFFLHFFCYNIKDSGQITTFVLMMFITSLYMVRMAQTKVLSREHNQKEGESYLCPFPGSR